MVYSFDLWKIFFGELNLIILAEVLLRIVIMYFYTFLHFRYILKKHSLNQMNAFGFIIVIALGSAVGDPMFQVDIPLIYGMLTITVVVLIERLISIAAQRNELLEHFFEGFPDPIIIDGQIQNHAMQTQEIPIPDLMMRLRSQGIEYVEQVKFAVLETSGQLSLIKNPQKIIDGTSTLTDVIKKKQKYFSKK